MQDKDIIWKIGEAAAKEYLKNKGYKIIEQNYRTKYAEIDLIVSRNNVLIFVEVRTKKSERFGSPEASINQKKLKKLYQNASAYISFKKWPGLSRIDAICIVLDSDNNIEKLEHYKNI
jgi:putative endonuclease|tara:strand:- start:7598 stop:7951 length:354 start_codon:yes stop_codon:yes gene_type:complete